MEEDITLSSLQAPLEKIIDKYPDESNADGAINDIECLANKIGIKFITVYRGYKVVRDLRSRRK